MPALLEESDVRIRSSLGPNGSAGWLLPDRCAPVFPAGCNMIRQSMVDLSRHPEWADIAMPFQGVRLIEVTP